MKTEQRIVELERRAAQLLDDGSAVEQMATWLTDAEIDELCDAHDNDPAAIASLTTDLYLRAQEREAAGVDVAQLNEAEQASKRWLRLAGGAIVSVYMDALGVWRLDQTYIRQQPELPERFSDAQVQAWSTGR